MQSASAPAQLSTRSSLAGLGGALDLFRELRAEMAVQLPLVFLLVAQHKGISAAMLGKLTGLSQSAVSRNIAALTKEGKADEPGLGLVVKTINPVNPKAHAIHLTKDGRAMAARLAETLGRALKPRRADEVRLGADGQGKAEAAARSVPEPFAETHWEVWVD